MNTFRLTDVDEVTKIIKKSSKATCQLDPAPTSLIIKVLPQLAPYISKVVNIEHFNLDISIKIKICNSSLLIKKPVQQISKS